MPDAVDAILSAINPPPPAEFNVPRRSPRADCEEACAPVRRQPDRVDPFTAAPGAVPFGDYLEALNRLHRIEPAVAGRALESDNEGDHGRDPRRATDGLGRALDLGEARRDEHLPRLADVAPVKPQVVEKIEMTYRLQAPGPTGRMVDLIV